mmetsp:Transcript_60475/g.171868  ORF Transcript_60475/g.171868 Transcript_60475/m.171868 type:complete len:209 (-) Transcript_60475:1562-2188(-)
MPWPAAPSPWAAAKFSAYSKARLAFDLLPTSVAALATARAVAAALPPAPAEPEGGACSSFQAAPGRNACARSSTRHLQPASPAARLSSGSRCHSRSAASVAPILWQPLRNVSMARWSGRTSRVATSISSSVRSAAGRSHASMWPLSRVVRSTTPRENPASAISCDTAAAPSRSPAVTRAFNKTEKSLRVGRPPPATYSRKAATAVCTL